jgi:SAM-dependent methyltransferase
VAGSIRGKDRHHPHRRRDFHRHRGLVIIDVPRFAGTTTVVTEVAPGVVRAERRYVEGSTEDLPGRGRARLAPFDPTPQEVVDRMLSLAAIEKDDVIYDLGSGDGRVLISAAKKHGIRGVGFEIDPGLVKLARENARREGVEQLVEIRQQDFRTADLSPASVVTLYLSYDGNLAVREQLKTHLKPGARIVSYTFDMGDWPPKITESYRDAAGETHAIYLWEIESPALASKNSEPMLQPHSTRNAPLIIEVR